MRYGAAKLHSVADGHFRPAKQAIDQARPCDCGVAACQTLLMNRNHSANTSHRLPRREVVPHPDASLNGRVRHTPNTAFHPPPLFRTKLNVRAATTATLERRQDATTGFSMQWLCHRWAAADGA